MKLTNKQLRDLETIKYFIPEGITDFSPYENDGFKVSGKKEFLRKSTIPDQPWRFIEDSEGRSPEEAFFEYSDGTAKNKEIRTYDLLSLYFYLEGKKWRGIHMQMYEEGVLSGDMPYFIILGGDAKEIRRKWWQFWRPKSSFQHIPIPREVVDFMKKEMFKGIDAEIIEDCYQSLYSSERE